MYKFNTLKTINYNVYVHNESLLSRVFVKLFQKKCFVVILLHFKKEKRQMKCCIWSLKEENQGSLTCLRIIYLGWAFNTQYTEIAISTMSYVRGFQIPLHYTNNVFLITLRWYQLWLTHSNAARSSSRRQYTSRNKPLYSFSIWYQSKFGKTYITRDAAE